MLCGVDELTLSRNLIVRCRSYFNVRLSYRDHYLYEKQLKIINLKAFCARMVNISNCDFYRSYLYNILDISNNYCQILLYTGHIHMRKMCT